MKFSKNQLKEIQDNVKNNRILLLEFLKDEEIR
jgi:hypothetical protein